MRQLTLLFCIIKSITQWLRSKYDDAHKVQVEEKHMITSSEFKSSAEDFHPNCAQDFVQDWTCMQKNLRYAANLMLLLFCAVAGGVELMHQSDACNTWELAHTNVLAPRRNISVSPSVRPLHWSAMGARIDQLYSSSQYHCQPTGPSILLWCCWYTDAADADAADANAADANC